MCAATLQCQSNTVNLGESIAGVPSFRSNYSSTPPTVHWCNGSLEFLLSTGTLRVCPYVRDYNGCNDAILVPFSCKCCERRANQLLTPLRWQCYFDILGLLGRLLTLSVIFSRFQWNFENVLSIEYSWEWNESWMSQTLYSFKIL